MKVNIRKGPVSLEIEVNLEDSVYSLQLLIQNSIPIDPKHQELSAIVNGSIVIIKQVKLDPAHSISVYIADDFPIFYLEELKNPIRSSCSFTSASTTSTLSVNNSFESWVVRAIKYCGFNNLESFLRLKEEFSYSPLFTLKEKTFSDLINSTVEKNWTCIHYVCKNGHSGFLQTLLNSGAECNLETDDGWTPLSLVSFYGFIMCAEILLNQASIQVNKKTDLKGTALHQACLGGNTKVVKLLLEARASPYIENEQGLIPLQLATKSSIIDLIPMYIGVDFLNKYAKEVNKPENHSGELYWTASWQINDKLVMVALDIETGVIFHYNTKSKYILQAKPDLQIPICEVQDILSMEENSMENKYFIHIRTLKDTFKYYSKNVDVSNLWVLRIRNALKYYQEHATDSVKNTYKQSRLFSIFNLDRLCFEEIDEEDQEESVSFASFEIVEEIGAGSFGKVFKVIKKNTGKRYAMKAVNKTELKRNNQLKYVIAECKILKNLKCPFIIPLYWAFQTPNNIYMIFEFCPHGDLSKQVKENGLPEAVCKFYISEIILAIEYLHSLNIVYRDLKPNNVLIDENCHLKLADFGLARENTDKSNPATTFCGSPGYLAPEILSNEGVWKPADIYSIGICLYQLLTGKLPFIEENTMKLYKSIMEKKINFPSTVSNNAKNLILSLTTKNPTKRLSIEEIKSHPFFEDIDWNALNEKEISPPVWLEEDKGELEITYFDDHDYTLTKDQVFLT